MSAQSFKKDVRRIAEFRAFYGSLSEIQRLWPEIVEARRAIEALIKTLKRVHGDDKYRKELARVVRDLRPKPKPKRVLFPQPGPDPKSEEWPAPGSEDTELGVLMELEVRHGEAEVHA